MENIHNDIERVQYTTYRYMNEIEKADHMKEMINRGFEILDNFEDKYEVVYRRFLDE